MITGLSGNLVSLTCPLGLFGSEAWGKKGWTTAADWMTQVNFFCRREQKKVLRTVSEETSLMRCGGEKGPVIMAGQPLIAPVRMVGILRRDPRLIKRRFVTNELVVRGREGEKMSPVIQTLPLGKESETHGGPPPKFVGERY